MEDGYIPDKKILKRYADILVRFALNSGQGVRKGEVVQCNVPDVAKALALELQESILKAGGHSIIQLIPTGFDKSFFQIANQEQLTFFPKPFWRARADMIDHVISIIAETDTQELKGIDPKKIMTSRDAKKLYREWLVDKETAGKFTWTCALWGTQAKAKEVKLSLKEYWQQIIKACFLDFSNPISKWRSVFVMQEKTKASLNKMKIEWVHVRGKDANIRIKIGADRIWNGGSGRNIPSFEIFTSPDWRGTSGWMHFNQPIYRYGNILSDVYLEFKDGLVVKAKAKKGHSLLQQMLKSVNADKLGEYSLTDRRVSRIDHIMAETLFDENISGPHGNTHMAIGMAYKDCYRGDGSKLKKNEWQKLGFNDSPEHTDFISTTERVVEATLAGGVKKVIYTDGQFTL